MMNTSAQPTPQPETLVQLTGVLLHHAEARTRASDAEGHMVPVLCLDIELETLHRNHFHGEQIFPNQESCEAAARRLRKGTRVTVDGPLAAARFTHLNVSHIHVHQPEDTAA
jgi:hypothetical protein